jgi:hypothetical protein
MPASAENVCFLGYFGSPRFRVVRTGFDPFQTSAARRAGYAKLSRNIIQVSDYLPTALILADSVDDLGRRGY